MGKVKRRFIESSGNRFVPQSWMKDWVFTILKPLIWHCLVIGGGVSSLNRTPWFMKCGRDDILSELTLLRLVLDLMPHFYARVCLQFKKWS